MLFGIIWKWLFNRIMKDKEKQYQRMKEIERKYNYKGQWKDCGDGTMMYIIGDIPIIDSLEMQ